MVGAGAGRRPALASWSPACTSTSPTTPASRSAASPAPGASSWCSSPPWPPAWRSRWSSARRGTAPRSASSWAGPSATSSTGCASTAPWSTSSAFYGWPSFNVADAAIVVGHDLPRAAGGRWPARVTRTRSARRPGDAGERLDVALAAHAGLSRAAAQRLIADGLVLVDGAPARKKHVLRAGEEVVWQAPPPPDAALAAEDVPSPSSTRTTGCSSSTSRPAWWCTRRRATSTGRWRRGSWRRAPAAATSSRPGIVHRLDKDTSGLLIVARRRRRLPAPRRRHGAARHPPHVPRAAHRRPAAGQGHHRRAHRPAPARPQAHVAAHGRRQAAP